MTSYKVQDIVTNAWLSEAPESKGVWSFDAEGVGQDEDTFEAFLKRYPAPRYGVFKVEVDGTETRVVRQ